MVCQSTRLDSSVTDAVASCNSIHLGKQTYKPVVKVQTCRPCAGIITDICAANSQNTTSGLSNFPQPHSCKRHGQFEFWCREVYFPWLQSKSLHTIYWGILCPLVDQINSSQIHRLSGKVILKSGESFSLIFSAYYSTKHLFKCYIKTRKKAVRWIYIINLVYLSSNLNFLG